jgi:putative ABC transport system ATP-binding protein
MATISQTELQTPQRRDTQPLIRVEDVHKYYDLGETRVHALRGVSVDVARGEFVAIMGASGSGKSTFMNILGCLDIPTSGRYWLEGTDASELDKKALALIRNQKIGFVFQGFNLLSRTTALENTELPTLYARLEKPEREARAWAALEMVGLKDRAGHYPSQMSGGQQQRVAVARALVTNPKLVLADEPTANLDSKTAHLVIELMRSMKDRFGTSFIFSTHDPRVMDVAEVTFRLTDGQLNGEGPAGSVRHG